MLAGTVAGEPGKLSAAAGVVGGRNWLRRQELGLQWMQNHSCTVGLFNVFACGLGHGKMSGLELNGIGGQFCSALSNKSQIKAPI